MIYRTTHCGALRATDAGTEVTLSGWVDTRRDHGGVIFIDLRDREGVTQIVFRPEEAPALAETSQHLRGEDVITISGRVDPRPEGTLNPRLATGEVEVVANALTVLNKSEVLPFQLDSKVANEDLRLEYRYLDLRRPGMIANLRLRHRVTKATRDYFDAMGFLEVETPILSNPTPEGARDFLVPSRLTPGAFYALPQAPQQYKQLLQVAGVEKYFQIARCFRDEDQRAERQLEFTQIDVEASFASDVEIQSVTEGLLAAIWKSAHGIDLDIPFPRMSYQDAIDRFGSDKPDLRFGMEIMDLCGVFAQSEFKVFRSVLDAGGVIRAINAKGAAEKLSKEQLKKWEEWAKTELGAKGLAYIKCGGDGAWDSPIVKFFSESEKKMLAEKTGFESGDVLFFGAGKRDEAAEILGRVRLRCADLLELNKGNKDLKFLWVIDFPLLAWDAESARWNAVHHPFTRPHPDDIAALGTGDPGSLRAVAYDVVLNGVELGGGSLRIHEPDLQSRLFDALGIGADEQQTKFGHLLRAFSFGAPPHGGIALGLDRILMLLAETDSIRDVIAFPKNNRGQDLLTRSPVEIDFKQLRELCLQSTAKK